MQADAKAKRSGIAPAQIVDETEQAWSRGHDEKVLTVALRPTRRPNERGANSCWITSGGSDTMRYSRTDNPYDDTTNVQSRCIIGHRQHHGEACRLP